MPFPARINKYVPGPAFDNVHHLIQHIMDGGWIYARGKLTSPKFAVNWSLLNLRYLARHGKSCRAYINPAWEAAQQQSRVNTQVDPNLEEIVF